MKVEENMASSARERESMKNKKRNILQCIYTYVESLIAKKHNYFYCFTTCRQRQTAFCNDILFSLSINQQLRLWYDHAVDVEWNQNVNGLECNDQTCFDQLIVSE